MRYDMHILPAVLACFVLVLPYPVQADGGRRIMMCGGSGPIDIPRPERPDGKGNGCALACHVAERRRSAEWA